MIVVKESSVAKDHPMPVWNAQRHLQLPAAVAAVVEKVQMIFVHSKKNEYNEKYLIAHSIDLLEIVVVEYPEETYSV